MRVLGPWRRDREETFAEEGAGRQPGRVVARMKRFWGKGKEASRILRILERNHGKYGKHGMGGAQGRGGEERGLEGFGGLRGFLAFYFDVRCWAFDVRRD